MSDIEVINQAKKCSRARTTLLLLVLILSLFTCCGGYYTLSALQSVTLGLFETEVQIDNKTDETQYLTPITTTYGDPRVITHWVISDR